MSVIAQNPILPGFYPDPSACVVGDDIYIVNSTFSYFPGLPIMHSKDMANWEQIGNVLTRESQLPLNEVGHSEGLFAPTIRYNNGTFYVICTNISRGGNFVVTATDPKGPWSEPHYLPKADGIDPSLFFDDDGKCYYIGTHPNPEGCRYNGDYFIYIWELDVETFEFVGEPHNVWNGAMRGCHWPEGPHLYKIGEYYYILHAEGGTGPEHAVCVARSKEIFGTYENNLCNPIFTHRHLGKRYPIQYAGHADLFQLSNGDWYMIMLAVRPANGYTTMGRETFLARVIWENDWPVVNPGMGVLTDEVVVDLPEYEREEISTSFPGIDKRYTFSKLNELGPEFMTLRNPKEDLYYFEEGEGLRLLCGEHALSENADTSFLCIRQDNHLFESSVSFLTDGLFNGATAGLALVQSDAYQLRVEYSGYHVNVYMRTNGKDERIASELMPSDKVTIVIAVTGIHASVFAGAGKEVAPIVENVDISGLSTEVSGGFVGCTIGMYAYQADATNTDKTYALFKSFTYKRLPLFSEQKEN